MTDEQFEGFLALLQRIVVAVEYPRLKEEEDQLRRWEYVKNLPLAMRPGVCQNCPFCGAESHLGSGRRYHWML